MTKQQWSQTEKKKSRLLTSGDCFQFIIGLFQPSHRTILSIPKILALYLDITKGLRRVDMVLPCVHVTMKRKLLFYRVGFAQHGKVIMIKVQCGG